VRVKVIVKGPSYGNAFDAPLDTSSDRAQEWVAFCKQLRIALNHAKQLDAIFMKHEATGKPAEEKEETDGRA
jgi:hypothetical protein